MDRSPAILHAADIEEVMEPPERQLELSEDQLVRGLENLARGGCT